MRYGGSGLAQRPLQRPRGEPQTPCGRAGVEGDASFVDHPSQARHDRVARQCLASQRRELVQQVDPGRRLDLEPRQRRSGVAEDAIGVGQPRNLTEPRDDGADEAVGPELRLPRDVAPQHVRVVARVGEKESERRWLDELETA